jgi:[ribosomal protein S5]-alanine N-acetyltransferase
MRMKELTDGTITLRAWRHSDAEWYASQAGDPEIQRQTKEPHDLTARQVREAITTYADHPSHRGWVICAAATGERLGNAAVDLDTGRLAYWVAAAARGRGVATAAVRLMADYAFDASELEMLRLWVKAGNDASARVAMKAGFVRAPELDETIEVKDELWTAAYFTLARRNRAKSETR